MNQKLKAKINWKQKECFVSKELFIITKSQTSRGLILGLKNIDWVILMKRQTFEKTCNFYNKFYILPAKELTYDQRIKI